MAEAPAIGTSMAAPHVAGVVAPMKALFPGPTPDAFDALLQSEYLTQDLGDADWDQQFGWGLIDAYKAVCIAQEGGGSDGLPAILSVSLASPQSSAEVTLENSGNADAALTISAYTADVSWLGAVPTDTDDNGLGTYAIAIDGLAYGDSYAIYAGTNPDGDGYICEDGEACGRIFPLISQQP